MQKGKSRHCHLEAKECTEAKSEEKGGTQFVSNKQCSDEETRWAWDSQKKSVKKMILWMRSIPHFHFRISACEQRDYVKVSLKDSNVFYTNFSMIYVYRELMLAAARYCLLHQHTTWDICAHLSLTGETDGKFYCPMHLSRPFSTPCRVHISMAVRVEEMTQRLANIEKTFVRQTVSHPYRFGLQGTFCCDNLFCHIKTRLKVPISSAKSFDFYSTMIC